MILERVKNKHDLHFEAINQLYNIAFPLHEQRMEKGRIRILDNPDFHLYKLIKKNQFVGFIGSWNIQGLFYIEHLAITAENRGEGLGQQALHYFCDEKKNVVLEIDPLVDEIARRRLRFYEHSGFVKNEYPHEHPNYRPEFSPHKLMVLSYQHQINKEDYARFYSALKNVIMKPEYL